MTWSFTAAGKPVQEGKQTFTLKPGERKKRASN